MNAQHQMIVPAIIFATACCNAFLLPELDQTHAQAILSVLSHTQSAATKHVFLFLALELTSAHKVQIAEPANTTNATVPCNVF